MAKKQEYRVTRGCSVIDAKGKIHGEGSMLPSDYAPKKVIEDHVKSRHVTPIGSAEQARIEASRYAPGVDPAVPTMSEDEQGVKTSAGDVHGRSLTKGPANPARVENSPWTLDPDGLKGKSLDELNVLIQERAQEDIQPMDTVEEAVAFLSQDYAPPSSK